MSDPFRLRVLKAMTDALKEITPANGYENDLSEAVFRGRDTFGDSDPLPMVSILENPRATDPSQLADGTGSSTQWELLIQGFVKDDFQNPTDPAYWLEAEIRKRLAAEKALARDFDGPGIFGLGQSAPCVTGIEIGNPVCRPADQETSDVAFCWLAVTLTLVEDLEKPFA